MADCIFCKIASGQVPARIVRRSPDAVAFYDLQPQAPVHILIIPTRHVSALRDADQSTLGRLLGFAGEVATELGLDAAGYRLVTNTGLDGGQSVFHLHFHLLGGRRMAWPPG